MVEDSTTYIEIPWSRGISSIGANDQNRTGIFSLEGCCSAIELHPHAGGVDKHRQHKNKNDEDERSSVGESAKQQSADFSILPFQFQIVAPQGRTRLSLRELP